MGQANRSRGRRIDPLMQLYNNVAELRHFVGARDACFPAAGLVAAQRGRVPAVPLVTLVTAVREDGRPA
jgi:hypothetical protein